MSGKRYKIVRFFLNGTRRTVLTGLTLEEAEAHCKNPETSSRTCRLARNKRRTKERGPWFDGFTHE